MAFKKSEQRAKQSIKMTVMVVMMCDCYDLARGWQALLTLTLYGALCKGEGFSLSGMFAGSAISVSVQ